MVVFKVFLSLTSLTEIHGMDKISETVIVLGLSGSVILIVPVGLYDPDPRPWGCWCGWWAVTSPVVAVMDRCGL